MGRLFARQVGIWKPHTGLVLDTGQVLVYDSQGISHTPTSACPEPKCRECANVTSAAHVPLASTTANFASPWGVVLASMAALGILICLIRMLYLILSFPVNYGTIVLSYMTLFGERERERIASGPNRALWRGRLERSATRIVSAFQAFARCTAWRICTS
jgi:hypothetical protein